MSKKKGLEVITETTRRLWYRVNEKYGEHKYTLGVNGLDEVVLSEGYTQEIAQGSKEVNSKLKELLNIQ